MPQIVRFNGVIYRTNANQDELEWSISGFDVTWSWAGFPNGQNIPELQLKEYKLPKRVRWLYLR